MDVLGPLPRLISTRVGEAVGRILSVFDDAVQLGLVGVRAKKIGKLIEEGFDYNQFT